MSSDVRVEPLACHPEAVAAVAGWLHQEWRGPLGQTLEETAADVRLRLNRDCLPLALVALAGGQAVGTASIAPDRLPDRPQPAPFLSAVYVVPGWRRRGVGSLLCARAVDEAKRLAIPTLFIYTTDLESYYERRGWRKRTDTLVRRGEEYRIVTFMERDTT